MKEVSKIYKITGMNRAQSYYTFMYPDGRKVQIPNLYAYDVEIPNPDIRNIKYTKQIVSGATYDIPFSNSNS